MKRATRLILLLIVALSLYVTGFLVLQFIFSRCWDISATDLKYGTGIILPNQGTLILRENLQHCSYAYIRMSNADYLAFVKDNDLTAQKHVYFKSFLQGYLVDYKIRERFLSEESEYGKDIMLLEGNQVECLAFTMTHSKDTICIYVRANNSR